jgi:hypothetical protein
MTSASTRTFAPVAAPPTTIGRILGVAAPPPRESSDALFRSVSSLGRIMALSYLDASTGFA